MIEKIENQFYLSQFGNPIVGNTNKMWTGLKKKPEVLREAVKIRRNKWNTSDIVAGPSICEAMLIDYDSVDSLAYNELIKSIYANTDIARIVVNEKTNHTFLLLSLWNSKLKLTEEQKQFAVNEALNSNVDVRYYILKNSNWTLEEKQRLVRDFWNNEEEFVQQLEEWEQELVKNVLVYVNYICCKQIDLDKDELIENGTYEMVLELCENQEVANKIWEELEFCKQMREIRNNFGLKR